MTHAGARLMIGFEGTEFREEIAKLIDDTGASALILFARNMESPEQVRTLIAAIRDAVERPLVFAVDQEEGQVVRLAHGLDVLPGAACLGRADSEDLARRAGRATSRRMAAMGFDLLLAPVVDLRGSPMNPITGLRSLGYDPELVGRLAQAQAEGIEEGGCAACAKHFPGLGPAGVDPHLELPVVDFGVDPTPDLRPFAILAPTLASMMSTHLVHPALDPQRPVTFSAEVLREHLREGMAFQGAILSDDLIMGGAAHPGGLGEAVVDAAVAGHDLLLICEGSENVRLAVDALERALKAGMIDLEEHEAAVARVRGLERRRPGETIPAGEDAAELALEIARAGLVVAGDRRRLPLVSQDRIRLLELGAGPIDPAEDDHARPAEALGRLLVEQGIPDVAVLADATEVAEGAFDRLLIVVRDLRAQEGHGESLHALQTAFPDRTIVLLAGPPSDSRAVLEPALVLDLGGARRAQLRAAAECLGQGPSAV